MTERSEIGLHHSGRLNTKLKGKPEHAADERRVACWILKSRITLISSCF